MVFFFFFFTVAWLSPVVHCGTIPDNGVYTFNYNKRTPLPEMTDVTSSENVYPIYQSGIPYKGNYQDVQKRAAFIIDRILKEIESANESNQLIDDWSPVTRKGKKKEPKRDRPGVYYKCYFNAISCFKRK
ncbi:hypothetical protein Phum_PHUM614090 [Pediculus humanus corporis]|uniref:Uncharacterized protein n=1 Tax=Pediculus humanus subsp. corporis TaxID=121224 RepID=E0W421_PEDHC|nr:uncharacterized protein Phum_PHUM614090 [Pediculus humanus corporis]EEB20377.1 hypothetical protein Phum_PHUM614090 [Pediculus humanus corporis]